ncbi:MAG: serine/threonine protein kinase, partial [Granulosicoccus sp.]|nr:serine/threonine protein kinase [Granulosicoccus sp.]
LTFLQSSELLPMESASVYLGVASDIMQQVHAAFTDTTVSALRIHGDFHPGNILWGRDDTPHILDLDDTCTGPAIQDLWMFISGDRQYSTARLADLLEGYTQFREFDPKELALIEPLRALRLLHYAAWIARRWDDPAFKLAFPFFAERRFWDDHILALREQRAMLDDPPLVWD